MSILPLVEYRSVFLPKLSESTLELEMMFPQLLQQYQECSDLMGLFGKHDSASVSLPKELSRDVQRFVSLVFIEI